MRDIVLALLSAVVITANICGISLLGTYVFHSDLTFQIIYVLVVSPLLMWELIRLFDNELKQERQRAIEAAKKK